MAYSSFFLVFVIIGNDVKITIKIESRYRCITELFVLNSLFCICITRAMLSVYTNVVLMLAERRRRWASIKTTLV